MARAHAVLLILVALGGGSLVEGATGSVAPAPPTISVAPPAVTNSGEARFEFSHSDPTVTFECSLDGAPFSLCTSPRLYDSLAEEAHSFQVMAVDSLGAPSDPAVHGWTVDLTSPVVLITSPANGSATNDPTPVFSGTAGTAAGDSGEVTVAIRLGTATTGKPHAELTASVTPLSGSWTGALAAPLAEGTYTAEAQQSDAAGNTSESAARTFTIDLTPPPPPSLTGPASPTKSTSATLSFSDSEAGVTFLCGLDGQPFAPCSSPRVYSGLTESQHAFAVKAKDVAGNESSQAVHEWTIDTTPPAVVLSSPANGSATNDPTPVFSGTAGTAAGDSGEVTVAIRLGTATTGSLHAELTASVAPLSGSWTGALATPLAEGTYTAKAQQSDAAGNTGVSTQSTFEVDLSVPGVTLDNPATGTVTSQRRPTFAGTADPGMVTVKVFDGAAVTGSPVQTMSAPVVGGTWSTSPQADLADGTHSVVAQMTSAPGTTGSSAAVLFIVDATAPTFATLPGDQTLEQSSAAGEPLSYSVAAADMLDPEPDVSCSPPPGARVSLGTTAVTCTIADWAGNTAAAGFSVTVRNTLPPLAVLGFSARAGDGWVRLAWQRPADWDYRQVVIQRARRNRSDWTTILETSEATRYTDRRVRNHREYTYRIQSRDTVGNASAAVAEDARPSGFFYPAWNRVVTSPPALRWSVVRSADYYNVQVWRSGRKILSRWPVRPRYTMGQKWSSFGHRFRLTSGVYYAYAWPGFGPKAEARFGRIVGWTRFVVR